MKSILLIISICVFSFSISNTQEISTIGNVTIERDKQLDQLVEYQITQNKINDHTQGYRIQITFSTIREDVYNAKIDFYRNFPNIQCYIVYEQPYHKLRAGAYLTKLEASKYLTRIIHAYPEAFIVRDRIKKKSN